MNKSKNFITIKNIIILVLSLICISLIICLLIFVKDKTLTLPSNADIQSGLENTFKEVNKLECSDFTKVKYDELVYKYSCTFEYILNEEVHKDYKSCVDCSIKDNKWICSISSSKCFK